jgi:hypothetical protein
MIAANPLYELKFYGGLLEEEDNFVDGLGNEFEYDEFIGKWIKKRKEKRSQNPKVIARREKRDEKRIAKGRKPRFSRPAPVRTSKPVEKQIAPDLPPKKEPIVSEPQVKKAMVESSSKSEEPSTKPMEQTETTTSEITTSLTTESTENQPQQASMLPFGMSKKTLVFVGVGVAALVVIGMIRK